MAIAAAADAAVPVTAILPTPAADAQETEATDAAGTEMTDGTEIVRKAAAETEMKDAQMSPPDLSRLLQDHQDRRLKTADVIISYGNTFCGIKRRLWNPDSKAVFLRVPAQRQSRVSEHIKNNSTGTPSITGYA